MKESKDNPSNVFPVTKIVKIPVYSSIRSENGKLVGKIEGFIDTPIEWLRKDNEGKVQ